MVGHDKSFDYMLRKLSQRIRMDLRTQEEMMKLLGALEQIFSMATPAPSIDSISYDESKPLIDIESDVESTDIELIKNKIETYNDDDEVDFVVDASSPSKEMVVS